jgi:glycosyltransferase involved in cell wall biosynthesis
MKVAMIVLNTVTHDVRVMKEATALTDNGYEVTIVGARGPNHPDREEVNGIDIFRVGRTASPFRRKETMRQLVAALFILCAFIAYEGEMWSLDSYARYLLTSPLVPSMLMLMAVLVLVQGRATASMRRAGQAWRNAFIVFRQIRSIRGYEKPIFSILDGIRPDVLHCHDLGGLIVGSYYRARHKCIVIYDSHEIFEETHGSSSVRKWYVRRIQDRLSTLCDALIMVNESAAEYMERKYPRMPKVTVIKNASTFQTPVRPQDFIRLKIGLPEKTKIALFQGGFTIGRGLFPLIDAAAYLNNSWVIVLMGWGKLENALKARANAQGTLNRKVFFLEKVSTDVLSEWTASADVGLIPYENTCLNHYFCTPNKLWEYPIAGVPILATDLPELAKAITRYQFGWLIPADLSAETIARRLNGLNDEELNRAKANCADFIAAENWDKNAKVLLDLYEGFRSNFSAQ